MIRPVPRSSMCGSTAWLMKNAPGQVDRQNLVPVLVGQLERGLVDRDPGVVDQHVEPAVAVDHLVDRPPAILGRADVALVDARGHAVLLELLEQTPRPARVAAVAGGDRRALLGEAANDRRADPTRAAGDERHPSRSCAPGARRPRTASSVGMIVSRRLGRSLVSVLINPSPLFALSLSRFRALGQPLRDARATAPCAPPSRRPARCAPRAEPGARRPGSRSTSKNGIVPGRGAMWSAPAVITSTL